jgi:hypothetical protein
LYLGGHGYLEVAIKNHGSLEVAHILFLCSFYYLIASSGIIAKVDYFLQQSPIHTITMSFQSFWNEEKQARLEKMRSEFLVWKDESSKRMEEIRKRIESFSPPRTSPTSQSLPKTGEFNASSVGPNFMPHIINVKAGKDIMMQPDFSERYFKPRWSCSRGRSCWTSCSS